MIHNTQRHYLRGACLAAMLAFGLVPAALAAPSIYPTGVTRYDPARAYSSYVLFGDNTNENDTKTYLIDMNGHVVHTWSHAGFPTKMLPPGAMDGKKGVIGVEISHEKSNGIGIIPGLPDVYQTKEIGFVGWNDKVLWKGGTTAPGGALHQHHDWARLPNGNVLALGSWQHEIPEFGKRVMYDDVIYELNPKGEIVWQWVTSEHLGELGFSDKQLALIHNTKLLDYFHINDMEPLGQGGRHTLCPRQHHDQRAQRELHRHHRQEDRPCRLANRAQLPGAQSASRCRPGAGPDQPDQRPA